MTDRLQMLIVEDEPTIARRIARMVIDILGPRVAAPSIVTSVDAAREAMASSAPDILFLDLNLEGDDGFDLLKNSPRCATIVVSAHTDRAMEGFHHGVRDFVSKPFSRARLELAIHRALENAPLTRPEFLGVRRGSVTTFVPFEEIVYIRGLGAHSQLILSDGRQIAHDHMLDRVERLLPPHFQRIHKSLIVDVRRVERLVTEEGSRYTVKLRDGTTLPVGRTRVRPLRARLG